MLVSISGENNKHMVNSQEADFMIFSKLHNNSGFPMTMWILPLVYQVHNCNPYNIDSLILNFLKKNYSFEPGQCAFFQFMDTAAAQDTALTISCQQELHRLQEHLFAYFYTFAILVIVRLGHAGSCWISSSPAARDRWGYETNLATIPLPNQKNRRQSEQKKGSSSSSLVE